MESWSSTKSYGLHDIVTCNGRTFYSLKNNNSDIPVYLGLSNLRDKPISWADEYHFTWQGSYSSENSADVEVKSIEYGDGYKKETPVGPSNDPIQLDYQLINLSDKEANAILNFLSERGGEVFIINLPFPYSRQLYFQCSDFSHTRNYQDVNTISAQLVETFYCPKPTYEVKSSYEVCQICDFNYNDMKKNYINYQYVNLVPDYDSSSGFGDELFIFQAWNPDTNSAEDFLVKAKRKKILPQNINNYNSYTDTNNLFLVAPFNVGGIIIDYVQLAKVGGDNLQKPSSTSQIRSYYLDGEIVTLWVEAYGPFGTMNRLRRETDCIITPQFLPFFFKNNDDLEINTESIVNGSIIDPSSYGVFYERAQAVALYWTLKTLAISYQWQWWIKLPDDQYEIVVEKSPMSPPSEDNLYPFNGSKLQSIGAMLSPAETPTIDINGINFAIFSRNIFNEKNPKKLALSDYIKAGVKFEVYWERIFNVILGTAMVPFGTNWSGYGPNGKVCGFGDFSGPLRNSISGTDILGQNALANSGQSLGSTSSTIPFAVTSYLARNTINNMTMAIGNFLYRRETIPIWISKIDFQGSVARCVDGFTRHYPKTFLNEAFRLYV